MESLRVGFRRADEAKDVVMALRRRSRTFQFVTVPARAPVDQALEIELYSRDLQKIVQGQVSRGSGHGAGALVQDPKIRDAKPEDQLRFKLHCNFPVLVEFVDSALTAATPQRPAIAPVISVATSPVALAHAIDAGRTAPPLVQSASAVSPPAAMAGATPWTYPELAKVFRQARLKFTSIAPVVGEMSAPVSAHSRSPQLNGRRGVTLEFETWLWANPLVTSEQLSDFSLLAATAVEHGAKDHFVRWLCAMPPIGVAHQGFRAAIWPHVALDQAPTTVLDQLRNKNWLRVGQHDARLGIVWRRALSTLLDLIDERHDTGAWANVRSLLAASTRIAVSPNPTPSSTIVRTLESVSEREIPTEIPVVVPDGLVATPMGDEVTTQPPRGVGHDLCGLTASYVDCQFPSRAADLENLVEAARSFVAASDDRGSDYLGQAEAFERLDGAVQDASASGAFRVNVWKQAQGRVAELLSLIERYISPDHVQGIAEQSLSIWPLQDVKSPARPAAELLLAPWLSKPTVRPTGESGIWISHIRKYLQASTSVADVLAGVRQTVSDEEWAAITTTPVEEPAADSTPEEHVRSALALRIEHLRCHPSLRIWRDERIADGWTKASVEQALAVLTPVCSAFNDNCWQAAIRWVAQAGVDTSLNRAKQLAGLPKELANEGATDLTQSTFRMLLPYLTPDSESGVFPQPNLVANRPQTKIVIADARFDLPPARARLHVYRAELLDQTTVAFEIALPVRLEFTGGTKPTRVGLSFQVEGAWAVGLPKAHVQENDRKVDINDSAWAESASGNWETDVGISVRVIRPADQKKAVRVVVRVFLGPNHEQSSIVEWPGADDLQLPVMEWPAAIAGGNAVSWPIGPQRSRELIVGALRGGRPALVVAPRRFGKTTLLHWIESEIENDSNCIAVRVDALADGAGSAFEPRQFWQAVSTKLAAKLSATGWSLPESGDWWPASVHFDTPRRMAAQMGKKYLVLLIDEAQAMFTAGEGTARGDRLKRILEEAASSSTLAGLLVCLVGLPSLQQRAGANFIGVAEVISASELSESEINLLIRKVTKGVLQTTKGTRDSIRKYAENLYFLQMFVQHLLTRAGQESRCWVVGEDAQQAVAKLLERIDTGQFENVGLLRDVLNTAESVSIWRPHRSWPVALALASIRGQQVNQGDATTLAHAQLTEWIALAWPDEEVRAVLQPTRQQIAKLITELRTIGVIGHTGHRIASELLERWLRADTQRLIECGFDDMVFRNCLHQLVAASIVLPDNRIRIKHGGQAEIFVVRNSDSEPDLAYRVWHLPAEGGHDALMRDQAVAHRLIRAHRTKKPGMTSVFNIEELGLLADNPAMAVQRYVWVPGETLAGQKLAHNAVIALAVQLSEALSAIHEVGVLHRDIKPDNVVIEDATFRPVLIDFGLSRVVGDSMVTRVQGPYCAPEVSAGEPASWTPAADVYSLAKTLLDIAREPLPLEKVLRKATAQRPEDRPTAAELCREFVAQSANLTVIGNTDERMAELHALLAWDSRLVEVLEACSTDVRAIAMGLVVSERQVAMIVADICNKLCESLFRAGRLAWSSLGDYSRSSGQMQQFFVLWQMRNNRNHYDQTHIPRATWQRANVIELVGHLGVALEEPGLEIVAAKLFGLMDGSV